MEKIPLLPEPKPFLNLQTIDSNFVEIRNNDCFEVRMQYPLLNMQHAENRCLVRTEVYDKLLYAHSFIPKGYKFLIYDAWRSLDLQKELYNKYSNEIIARYGLENYDKGQKDRIIKKYISIPNEDRSLPPVHTTGGAVDLTIIDLNGRELDMGCGFDSFEESAHTAYFEQVTNATVKNNRRLLYWAMIKAGFTNLPSEWWHYDYGDSFWGFYNNKSAVYKGCFDVKELQYEI